MQLTLGDTGGTEIYGAMNGVFIGKDILIFWKDAANIILKWVNVIVFYKV